MKQPLALLILYKEMGETVQHARIAAPVPFEEYLSGAEDARHAVERHVTVLEHVEVVGPELILDEDGHHGTHRAQETARVADGVNRQIADDVGAGIILPHLITGGREERQQYLVLWVVAAEALDDGPSLLKLAKRRRVYPDVACAGREPFFQVAERARLPLKQLLGFMVFQRGCTNPKFI